MSTDKTAEFFYKTNNLPKINEFQKIKTFNFPSINLEIDARKDFTEKYSSEIPSDFLIKKLRDFIRNDIVLELCSGLGLWAAYLKQEKVKIFPTDIKPSSNCFCHVLPFSARNAVETISTNILFLSHPPANSAEILDSVKAFKGKKIVYIGYEKSINDKMLNEYLFKKYYVNAKYSINGFGNFKNTMYFLVRK